jgi:hypothetical protein
MYVKGKSMNKTTKLFIYICWFGALGINIRMLVQSLSNNQPIFSNIVGVTLLVVAITTIHFSIAAKEKKT